MLDRLINIFFLFSLIFLFLLVADAQDHLRITVALVLSVLCAYIAFIINWLTLDGVFSAILFGIIAFGLAGLTGALIALAFFISSSLISKDMISEESLLDKKFRRDGIQVWSNGFWFALWIIVWFLTKEKVFLIAGVAGMASATSDTWASEIGTHYTKGKTWLVSNFEKVNPGTDGGISILGTIASLSGAMFIAIIFWLLDRDVTFATGAIVMMAGLLGSLIDSWIGATLQGKELKSWLKKIFARQISNVDNNMVNWMASGSASVIALLVILIIGQ